MNATKSATSKSAENAINIHGVVIRAHGRHFVVRHEGRDYSCEVRAMAKKAARDESPVVVGDNVEFSVSSDAQGIIERTLPRRTKFFRPSKLQNNKKQAIAANIDQLVAVVSVVLPELKPRLIDRFLISAELGGLEAVVVINKIDLGDRETAEALRAGYATIGIPVILLSCVTGEGLEDLRLAVAKKRSLFAGHSGVGKSTLLNTLLPGLTIKTQEVSAHTERGQHTTTSVELHELPTGGFLVDSPGLKRMGLWDVSKDDLPHYFREFASYSLKCRYTHCSHIVEPQCAVKDALAAGKIPAFRYDSYIRIRETL